MWFHFSFEEKKGECSPIDVSYAIIRFVRWCFLRFHEGRRKAKQLISVRLLFVNWDFLRTLDEIVTVVRKNQCQEQLREQKRE